MVDLLNSVLDESPLSPFWNALCLDLITSIGGKANSLSSVGWHALHKESGSLGLCRACGLCCCYSTLSS